jgi:Flagellar protein YcgR
VSHGTLDSSRIVVGKPLPFSVYTADGKLLLAAGRVVETERLRDLILQSGHRTELTGGGDGGADAEGTLRTRAARENAEREEEQAAARATPLERLQKDYTTNNEGRYLSLTMAKSETDKAHPVQLMGVHSRSIIVTTPVRSDGSLVPILAGQSWLCRTFQMTSAFRFTAVAVKTAFEPYPHAYLKLTKDVEHRRVRGAPRAKVLLKAELSAPDAMPCFLMDLSTSGARLVIDSGLALPKDAPARLNTTLEVLGTQYTLTLEGSIVNAFGPSDSRHPECAFYGLKFATPSERDGLILHGYVGDHLVSELHILWQMLRMASRVEE